jgi:hypothetical protein
MNKLLLINRCAPICLCLVFSQWKGILSKVLGSFGHVLVDSAAVYEGMSWKYVHALGSTARDVAASLALQKESRHLAWSKYLLEMYFSHPEASYSAMRHC